jgi:membrane-associated phospholipid phosphatase
MFLPLLISLLLACWAYLYFRTDIRIVKTIAEIFFWLTASLSFSVLMVSFEFKSIASSWPLQDAVMVRLDHAIGFDWITLRNFMIDRPRLREILFLAYGSYLLQPIIVITALAFSRPFRGNLELFALVALSAVIVISTAHFVPTLGPSDYLGFPTRVGQTIMAFRAGLPLANPYPAAIAFPSLHVVYAIAYTYGVRKTKLFAPMLCLNLLMLVSIPYEGDHYLVDIAAGALVALLSIQILNLVQSVEMRIGRPASLAEAPTFLREGNMAPIPRIPLSRT